MTEKEYVVKCNTGGVTRHLGIDLLRIVAMFMVCVLHVNSTSGSLEHAASQALGFRLGVWGSEAFCLPAVNLYAMVTGYVCIVGSWKFSRYLRLWMQVAFYTIGGFVVWGLLQRYAFPELTPVAWAACLDAFLPVPFASAYWYFTAYTALFLLIPFVNPLLHSLSAGKSRRLLALILCVFCVASLMEKNAVWNGGLNAVWLLALYVAGAYFRLHPVAVPSRWLLAGLCMGLGVALAYAVLLRHELNINYLFPPTVLASLCIFALFEKMKVQNRFFSRLIAALAPLSFGVYLAHCHPCAMGAMSRYLPGVFEDFGHGAWLYLVVPMVVYLGCSLVDACRVQLFRICRANVLADAMERVLRNLGNTLRRWLRPRVGSWFGLGAEPHACTTSMSSEGREVRKREGGQ